MIIWVIGVSSTGKTTLASEIVSRARGYGRSVALVDGDDIRNLFDDGLGHSLSERRVNTERIAKICTFLDSQGIHAVCAVQSLFPDIREWCRENYSSYFEIYIESPMEQLVKRDTKDIYEGFRRGEVRNVAGLDLHFPVPISPDLVIQNSGSKQELLGHAEAVAQTLSQA